MEHPEITQIMQTGYPADMQKEPEGTDYFGNEYFAGEEIVITEDNEVIRLESLEDYLIEVKGIRFTKA
ncbi:YqaI family protein [Domibacillus iocasae]|uniref:YqaI family protein n=1 Tax=Domibacillus iocasae TaxID=1714016 RepID=UPI003CCB9A81